METIRHVQGVQPPPPKANINIRNRNYIHNRLLGLYYFIIFYVEYKIVMTVSNIFQFPIWSSNGPRLEKLNRSYIGLLETSQPVGLILHFGPLPKRNSGYGPEHN